MTLYNFRSAYQSAVNSLPEFHMDAAQFPDESYHKRIIFRRRKMQFTAAVTATVMILLCGFGTATAMNNWKSVIQIKDNGLQISSSIAASETPIPESRIRGGAESGGIIGQSDVVVEVEIEVYETIEYGSIEEFMENEDIAAAFPDFTLFGEEHSLEIVNVMNKSLYVTVEFSEEKSFYLRQYDYREYTNNHTDMLFPGEETRNERTVINYQGLEFTVFDSLEGGERIAVHAAVSCNGRNLVLDFYGFEDEIINKVLNKYDLSTYFDK